MVVIQLRGIGYWFSLNLFLFRVWRVFRQGANPAPRLTLFRVNATTPAIIFRTSFGSLCRSATRAEVDAKSIDAPVLLDLWLGRAGLVEYEGGSEVGRLQVVPKRGLDDDPPDARAGGGGYGG